MIDHTAFVQENGKEKHPIVTSISSMISVLSSLHQCPNQACAEMIQLKNCKNEKYPPAVEATS
jgi:hypothetical protein